MNEILPKIGDYVRLEGNSTYRGVVKYCGPIADTSGIWVGIDWDDPKRGKHNGSAKGHQYFQARCENSGSFVRPSALSLGSELVEEVKKRYADEPLSNVTIDRWELKLEKTYEKQKYIFGYLIKNIFALKCIVLSGTNVSHISSKPEICFGRCTELDLSGTLLSKWTDLFEILKHFPVLRTLHLSDTRMEPLLMEEEPLLPPILQISLQNAFFSPETINNITRIFKNLEEIHASSNDLPCYSPLGHVANLRQIDLQQNCISSISRIASLQYLPLLQFLNISSCGLTSICFDKDRDVFPSLEVLVVRDNPIFEWSAIDELSTLPRLKKLVIRGTQLPSVTGLNVRDLIICKVPKIVGLI